MLRRNFIATGVIALSPLRGVCLTKQYGWTPPLSVPDTTFKDTFPDLQGIGKGKIVLLYKYIEKILGKSLVSHKQTGPDCTSQASGLGMDFVQAIQSVLRRDRWIGKIATEILHIGGLKVIGKRKRNGVAVHESITFAKKYGLLFRKKYRDYDFTNYNYDNCNKLLKGIPEWLLGECKKCQLIKAIRISNWNEARDAIYNLYPIIIGSMVGFSGAKRNKDGFAEPNNKWAHAWLLIGIDDRHNRPGACLMNCWGDNWVKGPRRHSQPKGSIWVDKDVITKMLKQYDDSYALCRLSGLTPSEYNLWPK